MVALTTVTDASLDKSPNEVKEIKDFMLEREFKHVIYGPMAVKANLKILVFVRFDREYIQRRRRGRRKKKTDTLCYI